MIYHRFNQQRLESLRKFGPCNDDWTKDEKILASVAVVALIALIVVLAII